MTSETTKDRASFRSHFNQSLQRGVVNVLARQALAGEHLFYCRQQGRNRAIDPSRHVTNIPDRKDVSPGTAEPTHVVTSFSAAVSGVFG